jgi:hypothetical protein
LSPVRPGRAYSSRARATSAGSRHTSQSGYPRSGSVSDVDRAESLLSVPLEEDSDELAAEAAGDIGVDDLPEEDDESGNEEDDESGSNEDTEGVTVRDRQDVSRLARATNSCHQLTPSRLSTLSTPLVCRFGSLRCTASPARLLAMPRMHSTRGRRLRPSDTCFRAICCGRCCSAGGSRCRALLSQ